MRISNHNLVPVAVALFIAVVLAPSTAAARYRVIYSFCVDNDCADGANPIGGIARDATGNLIGFTKGGGDTGEGTVYLLRPASHRWKYERLYSFCHRGWSHCREGAEPRSTPVIDVHGNIYGTTSSSTYCKGCDVVFELSPLGGKWTFKVLHAFAKDGMDGLSPSSLSYVGQGNNALYDGVSPLFGTTSGGGINGEGILFSITPNGSAWQEQIIHQFCSKGCTSDGYRPMGGVVVEANDLIVGTTYYGGANDEGTLFRFSGGGNNWSETILFDFCQFCGNGWNGTQPYGNIVRDGAGNFYGEGSGGKSPYAGVVWEVSPQGVYSKIWNCDSKPNSGDCVTPVAVLIDSRGGLFGTAETGGKPNEGTVFRLDCCSEDSTWSEETLHTFCKEDGCPDGTNPLADRLLSDENGNFYGTAFKGGAHFNGVVFEVTP